MGGVSRAYANFPPHFYTINLISFVIARAQRIRRNLLNDEIASALPKK